ncbi:MAG: glycosyltransferase family A protein [Verrucomicrobiia bacterium]
MHICVCICTYKRPRLLKKLLLELGKQETAGEFTYSVVVADNDRQESARSVVDEIAAGSRVSIQYCVEPEQNIAMVRNKAVSHAHGDLIAFIDDDEFPPADWLLTALRTCQTYRADGVLAPVRPYFEHEPPEWLIKGRFCERPEHATGYKLAWRETRTGNALVQRRVLEGLEVPFQTALGNGGEDQDFFRRLMESGHVFVWCREAAVHEIVPPERCKRSYMLKRALLRGQNEKRLADFRGIAKALVAVPLYSIMLPFALLTGQHHFMKYLIRLCDHAGRLMGVLGLKPLGDKYING